MGIRDYHRSVTGGEPFATTHWQTVQTAGHRSSPDCQQALAALCETYWYPLYAYVRRRVADIHEAQDLTQAFFAELLEKNYVASAMPERGRFRAFLLTACKHFLSKQWEKANAQKRGGGRVPISLDFYAADSTLRIDPAGGMTAEAFYNQQWALALLRRIVDQLETEFTERGKASQFAGLKGFLVGDDGGCTYAQAAGGLGMTEAAVKKAVSRLRGRYRELLRDEIAQTVTEPEEIDEEIRALFAALQA